MTFAIVGEDVVPETGGVADLTHSHASGASEMGVNVSLITDKKELLGRKTSYEVKVVKKKYERWYNVIKENNKKIREIINDVNPSFILINYIASYAGHLSQSAAMVARSEGIPFGFLAHGQEFLWSDMFRRVLRLHSTRGARMIVASSQYTAGLVKSNLFWQVPTHVVNPGTDMISHRASETEIRNFRERYGISGENIIGTLGRLVERKGHDQVIRSLRSIDVHGDIEYLVAGSGSRDRLEKIAREEGVRENVRFLGRIHESEKAPFLGLCDVFVMPSRRIGKRSVEGFGIVFAEAAASGTVTVAADTGGVSDAIKFGETGLQVDPKSSKDISKKISFLLNNNVERKSMEDKAVSFAEKKLHYKESAKRLVSKVEKYIR